MPLYYHYTDEEGAQKIIRTGRIMASLDFKAQGDASFGNGVYLSMLNPTTTSKTDIAINNWMDSSDLYMNKTNYYFVLDIPASKVTDTKATGRNIFLYGKCNDLRLIKYPWWLKKYESPETIIASYKYKLASLGPAATIHGEKMGDYVMTEETVNGRPVYKQCQPEDSNPLYLYLCSNGSWYVNSKAGENAASVWQRSNFSLGPDTALPWLFFDRGNNVKRRDDATLKAYAWQT